eukprot:11424617-Alexandrium_andersonii.AAC.1
MVADCEVWIAHGGFRLGISSESSRLRVPRSWFRVRGLRSYVGGSGCGGVRPMDCGLRIAEESARQIAECALL